MECYPLEISFDCLTGLKAAKSDVYVNVAFSNDGNPPYTECQSPISVIKGKSHTWEPNVMNFSVSANSLEDPDCRPYLTMIIMSSSQIWSCDPEIIGTVAVPIKEIFSVARDFVHTFPYKVNPAGELHFTYRFHPRALELAPPAVAPPPPTAADEWNIPADSPK